MENSYDLNLVRSNFVKYSERKSTNNDASEISIYDGIEVGITNDSRQGVIDTFHELRVQILALVGVPLAGLGQFGVGGVSEPNDHVRLARFHEFSFDLIPGSALSGIAFS